MNVFTIVLLVFAVAAFADKAVGMKTGLGDSIDTGMATMGPTTVAMLGSYTVGVAFINAHAGSVAALADVLPFDPSMIMGVTLAPETGGYSLASQMTDDSSMLMFNGVILAGLLGQLISFQFPVFMAALDRVDHSIAIKGFIVGIVVIPIGFITAALMLRISFADFAAEFIPVLLICLVLGLGMIKAQRRTVRIVGGFARLIQILIYLLLMIALAGIFVPSLAYAGDALVDNALRVILRCTIIVCGALTLSNLVIRIFRKQLGAIAAKIGVNEVTIIALVLNCINSLAILPLYRKMDEKGKLMNAAFSVSGAYFLGGQLGFVASSVDSGWYLLTYLVSKVLCGAISLVIAAKMYTRLTGEKTEGGQTMQTAAEEAA